MQILTKIQLQKTCATAMLKIDSFLKNEKGSDYDLAADYDSVIKV